MKRQRFTRRVVFPVSLVLGIMIAAINGYDLSGHIENRLLHLILSNVSAFLMFLSIWLGAFFANTLAFFKGATFIERILVCLATPVIGCIKILSGFWGIYSAG